MVTSIYSRNVAMNIPSYGCCTVRSVQIKLSKCIKKYQQTMVFCLKDCKKLHNIFFQILSFKKISAVKPSIKLLLKFLHSKIFISNLLCLNYANGMLINASRSSVCFQHTVRKKEKKTIHFDRINKLTQILVDSLKIRKKERRGVCSTSQF